MKAMKWARGVNRGVVRQVLSIEPIDVLYEVNAPQYIKATIETDEGDLFCGVALCSSMDKPYFDYAKGKEKALQRAVVAYRRMKDSMPIRDPIHTPRSWKPAQQRQLERMRNRFPFKSFFIPLESR